MKILFSDPLDKNTSINNLKIKLSLSGIEKHDIIKYSQSQVKLKNKSETEAKNSQANHHQIDYYIRCHHHHHHHAH